MGGVGMKIPEWVDNRVVFALVFTLGIDDLARSTGLPIGLMEFVLVPLAWISTQPCSPKGKGTELRFGAVGNNRELL